MDRTYVSFEADFPDDGEWDDQGNVICPPGLAIAKSLQAAFKSESIDVGDPENHEDFGWEFDCSVGRAGLWVLLQFATPWLVIVHRRPWILNPVRRGARIEALQRVCRTIDKTLKSDPRFRQVEWFTREEYERRRRSRGASAP